MRIDQIPEAEIVTIELGERHEDYQNLARAANYVVGGKDAFLESVARRAKYEFFLGKVIAKNHVGSLPRAVVYRGSRSGWDTPYRVVEVKPDGEVQVTPKTTITCKLIEL